MKKPKLKKPYIVLLPDYAVRSGYYKDILIPYLRKPYLQQHWCCRKGFMGYMLSRYYLAIDIIVMGYYDILRCFYFIGWMKTGEGEILSIKDFRLCWPHDFLKKEVARIRRRKQKAVL